jgi:hypothetical protein
MFRDLALVLCVLCACGNEAAAQRVGSPLALVPSNSIVVIKLNWKTIQRDEQLRRVVIGNEFERLLRQWSLDSNEVTECAIFSDLKSSSAAITGMILSGTYNSREVISRLKGLGWKGYSYRARTVYSNEVDGSHLASLKSGLLIVGTKASVESVIEVEAKPRAGLMLKQPLRTIFTSLGADRQPLSFMMALPEMYQDMADIAFKVGTTVINLAGLSPLGTILDKIGLARALGFSISREGHSFPTQIVALMKDESAAGLVSGTLNLLKSLPLMVSNSRTSPRDSEAMEALRGASVGRKGALLSIKFRMPESIMPH